MSSGIQETYYVIKMSTVLICNWELIYFTKWVISKEGVSSI